jgi:hypothetical protein
LTARQVRVFGKKEDMEIGLGSAQFQRSRMGIVGIHPGSFRKSGKCRTYRIRNLEECTEDGRSWKAMGDLRPPSAYVFIKD